ncbi:MAG: DUF1549 domain-containing protein [Planctomycetota bacterium]
MSLRDSKHPVVDPLRVLGLAAMLIFAAFGVTRASDPGKADGSSRDADGSSRKADGSSRGDHPKANQSDRTKPVSFHRDVEPIFARHCYSCHQGAKQAGEYRMTDFAAMRVGGETGLPAIVPGDAEESYLMEQIQIVDGHAEMPDEPFPPLAPEQIEIIRRWIQQGASDDSPPSPAPYSAENLPEYFGNPAITSIALSPDGQSLAVAGRHEVLLIGTGDGEGIRDLEAIRHLVGRSPRINSVRFSPDGKRLGVAGGQPGVRGEFQIWDVASGGLRVSRDVTFDTLTGLTWSPDGKLIALGCNDKTLRAFESETGQQVVFQGAHEDWVRDTAFTADGKHLVSVARDMTCKLTEVDTERFVDNITSITPGALSGGLSSVVAHPQRDEIVVGGADGIAKVYRVFRKTQRRIGDDANLIRALPKLPGRITEVAITPDAKHLLAVATLDGKSTLAVWAYDFDGEISEPLKKILAKRVSDRTAEEKQIVASARSAKTTEVGRFEIADAAVYAIAASDASVWIATDDGRLIQCDLAGKMLRTIRPFLNLKQNKQLLNQSASVVGPLRQQMLSTFEVRNVSDSLASSISELSVSPESIVWSSPHETTQLVVTGTDANGNRYDLTRHCTIDAPPGVTVDATGSLAPRANTHLASATITIHFQAHRLSVPVSTRGSFGDGAVDYRRDVAPVMARLGCNQGTCHGAQKGKNGFRLSLRGYDPVFDLRALADDLEARRIDRAFPEDSLMLRKPLGTTPHQGGVLMNRGDRYHNILRRWISDGSRVDLQAPRVTAIEVTPRNPIIQNIGDRQQVRVVATFADGVRRDVTRDAFIESGNTEVATSGVGGLLTSLRRGEAAILARFEGAYDATTLTVMGNRDGYVEAQTPIWNEIDKWVAQKWKRLRIQPSGLADDATFLRRVHLDLTGLPPSSTAVRGFLADPRPTRVKRGEVVQRLLGNDDYVTHHTNRWADLLQVNRKFLGVEGAEPFRQWIKQSIQDRQPYDQFAYEILTASGSNATHPPASYYKILRDPESLVENTTHLFLGIRFNCNKCHDHPFERWTQDNYYETAAFFSQVQRVAAPEAKNRRIGGTAVEGAKPLFETIADHDAGEVTHPTRGDTVTPAFPFAWDSFETQTASSVDIAESAAATHAAKGLTRREQFARWCTDSQNPYFARSYANRIWASLMGVGLIEPVDDIRAGNPATHPELLDYLTQELIDSGFDTQHLQRLICNSRTYQLAVESLPLNHDDTANYARARARRLPAEVIFDAVHFASGSISEIPGMPRGTRAAALTDAGVKLKDGFLQNLGRPVRESACTCERSDDLQLGPVMAMVSGPTISSVIADPNNDLNSLIGRLDSDAELADELFLRFLGRLPSASQRQAYLDSIDRIAQDQMKIEAKLAAAEADWKERFALLEAQRKSKHAATLRAIEDRKLAIAPEREKLERQRQEKIQAAQHAYDAGLAKLDETIRSIRKKRFDNPRASHSWLPLQPISATASQGDQLEIQPDRSVRARGKAAKGKYTTQYLAGVKSVTGLRLEVLADSSLPSSGPGLGANGNFVITELKCFRESAETPGKWIPVAIESGASDFNQGGFSPAKTLDGRTRDQGGWAVAGATGVDHWIEYRLKEPVDADRIKIELHQFHNAAQHRVGRYRISITTDTDAKPLGYGDSIAAALDSSSAAKDWTPSESLRNYFGVVNSGLVKLRNALAAAKRPVPPDAELMRMNELAKKQSQTTPTDPSLIRLRDDVAYGREQIKNLRRTAAEDLIWALVNSPAFLFNH